MSLLDRGARAAASHLLPEPVDPPDTGQAREEARFRHLASLPLGWDSYGADRIDPDCIDRARSVLTALRGPVSISGTVGGGIFLTWQDEHVTFEIDPGGRLTASVGDDYASSDLDEPAAASAAVPDTGQPPLDFDLLVRSIVDSRYVWISMENAVDMAVTTARLLVDAGAVVIVADGQPVEVCGSLGAMRRLVHSRGITADERDHDVAVSRPVPPLEGRERDRLREVLDAAGLPRDRGWDDVLLALRSMGARAVPDTGE